jgi:MATE family multidrug resistance protein
LFNHEGASDEFKLLYYYNTFILIDSSIITVQNKIYIAIDEKRGHIMTKNWKTILLLAIPSIISFASMTVTGTVSLIMVGQMGALVIAIVGVSNIIMYNAWAIFSGIGHTVNYLVAQNYGSNDMKKGIERTYIALYLTALVAVIIFIVGHFASEGILRLIGGSESKDIVSGEAYLRIRFYAMSFGILNFVFHGFFRVIGDTLTPMVLSIASNVIIVFLTFTLTFGNLGFPELGLVGAGWAFLIGEAVGLFGCLYVYFVKLHRIYHTRSKVLFDRVEAKLILQESGKLGVQEFSLSISMLIFTIFVAHLGTEALAANEIALSVMSFGFMPAFAFGATATILVGQQIGKGNPLLARRMGTDTAVLGSIFIFVLGLVEFILAEPIARMYTDDAGVYQLAGFLIMISAFLQMFDGLLNFYAGGLRGIGDTAFLLKISFVLGWFFFVPMSYLTIFVLEWGSVGAWLSLYMFLIVFGLSVMIRFYKTDWLKVQMKRAVKDE